MLDRVARRITAASSWPRVGLLLLAYIACVAVLSAAEGKIKERSGGLGVPDLMQYFTADDLHARLAAFGEEGRRIYLQAELVDMIYPLVYTAFFASIIALTMKRLSGDASNARLLCVLPLCAMLCDYLENVGIFVVARAFPARRDAVATAAGLFNACKWGVFAFVLPIAVIGLIASGIQRIRRGASPG